MRTPTVVASAPDQRDSSLRISDVPLLAPEHSTSDLSESTRNSARQMEPEMPAAAATSQPATKPGKRRFFGLGRRREDVVDDGKAVPPPGASVPARAVSPTSMPAANARPSTSPQLTNHPYQHVSSPGRYSYSPSLGIPSPASSSIFERDVQENTLSPPSSVAIPSHISREDHIPPVLEASSLAITDERLDPDEVKIVMHASHHPVAAPVTGHSSIDASISTLPEEPYALDKDGAASSYGALDTHDVRRLSFISFADVVQAEHMTNKDSLMSSPRNAFNRSPSPVYSRSSSQGPSTSPPTSGPASAGPLEGFPSVKGPGSPVSVHSSLSVGELTVETMRQALRKTGSSDLTGFRSVPMSAVSNEDYAHDVPWH